MCCSGLSVEDTTCTPGFVGFASSQAACAKLYPAQCSPCDPMGSSRHVGVCKFSEAVNLWHSPATIGVGVVAITIGLAFTLFVVDTALRRFVPQTDSHQYSHSTTTQQQQQQRVVVARPGTADPASAAAAAPGSTNSSNGGSIHSGNPEAGASDHGLQAPLIGTSNEPAVDASVPVQALHN